MINELIFSETDVIKKTVKGETVDRYEIRWDGTYLIYPYTLIRDKTVVLSEDELQKHTETYNYLLNSREILSGRDYFDNSAKAWYELWNQRDLNHQQSRKIIVQENSSHNEFVIDTGNYFYLDTCCGIEIAPATNLSDSYILSLLNSKLLDFIFKQITVPKAGGHFIHKPMFLEKLPIYITTFSTSKNERSNIVKDVKSFYIRDDYNYITQWAESELSAHRDDTIHDILSFLAEQMIEMNKKKNEEINGFLTWLGRELGVEIDTLTNKTYVKDYHEYDFDHLLDVLKKNKNKISLDPTGRKAQESIEKEFNKSMVVLAPLKEKIKATDDLIDQIVYKLYGLTDEEIKIVEGKTG